MINKIKAERNAAGLTQEKLAELISVTKQTIHAIETGKYIPSTILALKIAAVFAKPVEELFLLENIDYY